MPTLKCGVFSCSTLYGGFCVNLLQPTAWTGDTYSGYDIVIDITILVWVWFSLTMRMGLRTLSESSGTAHAIWLRKSVFVQQDASAFMRIMPSSSWLVYLDVVDTGYINLMVWIFDLNFVPYCFGVVYWPFILRCELVITVEDVLRRNNCIELTYIEDVEQNILFSILVWSWKMLSLCDELLWRWNLVFQGCLFTWQRVTTHVDSTLFLRNYVL